MKDTDMADRSRRLSIVVGVMLLALAACGTERPAAGVSKDEYVATVNSLCSSMAPSPRPTDLTQAESEAFDAREEEKDRLLFQRVAAVERPPEDAEELEAKFFEPFQGFLLGELAADDLAVEQAIQYARNYGLTECT